MTLMHELELEYHCFTCVYVLPFSLLPKAVCVCLCVRLPCPHQLSPEAMLHFQHRASGPLMDCLLISSLGSIALTLELCVCVRGKVALRQEYK